MNLGQVQAALLRDLIQRDDVNAEALTNSVRYAHRELQERFNWRAMYHRISEVDYASGNTEGVLIESDDDLDDCKHIIEVFKEIYAGSPPALTGLETLWPETQASAARARRISQIAQRAQPSEANGWNQGWYDRGRKVALKIIPQANLKLTVDFYRFLPFYIGGSPAAEADPSVSDFFSNALPHLLQAGAAYWLCKNTLEDARAEAFYGRFVNEAAAAYAADDMARQGGLAQQYSAPVAQQARAAERQ